MTRLGPFDLPGSYVGDCRDLLAQLPDASVQCVVTSPPYWGLRDYGTANWQGGAPGCDHRESSAARAARSAAVSTLEGGRDVVHRSHVYRGDCGRCGARRIDRQIGIERTWPEYVAALVDVFRELRRVLRDDGVAWLNLGDCYATGAGAVGDCPSGGEQGARWRGDGSKHDYGIGPVTQPNRMPQPGLKPKDLVGIPWRVAFALQDDGWWLRADVVWCLSGGTWLYARTPTGIGPAMLKDLVRLKPETVELWGGERWTRVTAWTRRQGRADAVELVLRSGERIGCTGSHVWPTTRGNIRTDELRVGDEIAITRLPTSGDTAGWLTEDALWFAGLYLADGSRSGETIQIAGHIRESARWPRIEALVTHYGGSARRYTKGNSESICVDSIGLDAVVRHLIAGRTAKDKHLTGRAWQLRDWSLKRLAEGYLEGDGHTEPTRIRLGFCRNYSLERDLRCLGARLGAVVVIKPCVAKNQTASFPAFKGEWRWSRTGHHNERALGQVVKIRHSRARQFWDVTVADHPHLFALASGVLTHNSKPNPMPESVRDRPTKAHEYLFLLAKSERYFYDADAIREPVAYGDHPRNGRPGYLAQSPGQPAQSGLTRLRRSGNKERKIAAGGEGECPADHLGSGVPWEDDGRGRNRRSVWTVATAPYLGAHFATFPPALIEPCVLAGSRPGDLVLDPFFGSGTTGEVAEKHGRLWLGFDLNPDYKRLQDERTAQRTLPGVAR